MRVFNEDKTIELNDYDLEKGYLKNDKLFIAHHEAEDGVDGVTRYEVVSESQNGRSIKKVTVVEPIPPKKEYDEYEDIQVYIPYAESELARREIIDLKGKLRDTDYQAIKYAEGQISEEEYAEIKAQRQAWRDRINELETI